MASESAAKKKGLLQRFWAWYERNYTLNLTLTTLLFALQLVHLYWLSAHVVSLRVVGESYFTLTPVWEYLIILVDYTEIPALISTSVLYLFELQKKWSWKHVWFLFSLNVQWLHLFWITDAFVISRFSGAPDTTIFPLWLAWVAILIDYLELPVIVDTVIRLIKAIAKGRLAEFKVEN